MEKCDLLSQLTALDFAAVDLGLYLDTHPKDKEALRKYNVVVDEANKVRRVYEMEYGPLYSFRSISKDNWQWIDDPWPWQEKFNYNMAREED